MDTGVENDICSHGGILPEELRRFTSSLADPGRHGDISPNGEFIYSRLITLLYFKYCLWAAIAIRDLTFKTRIHSRHSELELTW